MAGHFTQSECAEVIVFYRYEWGYGVNMATFEVSFLKLKGKKFKSVGKSIQANIIAIQNAVHKKDINKDGVDEILILSSNDGVIIDERKARTY